MNFRPKSPNLAKSRRPAEHSSFDFVQAVCGFAGLAGVRYLSLRSAFQFSAFQLYPDTPFSPASGPATGSFNGLHPKSKFLAVGVPYADCIEKNFVVINIRSSLYPKYYEPITDIRKFASDFRFEDGNVDLLFVSKRVLGVDELVASFGALSK
jgi:hypothetical protein